MNPAIAGPEVELVSRAIGTAIVNQRLVGQAASGFREIEADLPGYSVVGADDDYILAFAQQMVARPCYGLSRLFPTVHAAKRVNFRWQTSLGDFLDESRVVANDNHNQAEDYANRQPDPNWADALPPSSVPIDHCEAEHRDDGGSDPVFENARVQRIEPVTEEDRSAHCKKVNHQLVLFSEAPESERGPDCRDEIDWVQQACLSTQKLKKV